MSITVVLMQLLRYATEWTSTAIKIWFWPAGSAPHDLVTGQPDPTTWGSPHANFANANLDNYFSNHQIILNTGLTLCPYYAITTNIAVALCGDWAGGVWNQFCAASTQYSSCAEYVAGNGNAFSG